jgi:tetrapyrrole methylase family protein/MazG family protein
MKIRKKLAQTRIPHPKERGSILKTVPKGLPSLSLAYHLTQKASRVGFDWPDLNGILKKLDEELEELRETLSLKKRNRIREEIGDLLFVIVNIARFLRIDPETALKRTVEKFISRFAYIERALQKKGKTLLESDLFEMDRLWEEAKKKNR